MILKWLNSCLNFFWWYLIWSIYLIPVKEKIKKEGKKRKRVKNDLSKKYTYRVKLSLADWLLHYREQIFNFLIELYIWFRRFSQMKMLKDNFFKNFFQNEFFEENLHIYNKRIINRNKIFNIYILWLVLLHLVLLSWLDYLSFSLSEFSERENSKVSSNMIPLEWE